MPVENDQQHRTPLPLYYRLDNESWEDVANRYIEAILTLDPDLASASIQGANAIRRVGMPLGMVLAAAGLQIAEAKRLLDQPKDTTLKRRDYRA